MDKKKIIGISSAVRIHRFPKPFNMLRRDIIKLFT